MQPFILVTLTSGSFYGVSWNENADTYARTGILTGVAVGSSPGNAKLPIHAQIKRVVLNAAGVVQYYLDANSSYNKDGVSPSVTGTDDVGAANKLSDNGIFTEAEAEYKGRYVHNTTDDTYALITAKDSNNVLSIDSDIMANGETFEVCTAVLNGDDGQVMVEVPKFYLRYTYSGTTHTWDIAFRATNSDFIIHPAFVKNGQEVDFRYMGAFEGIGWEAGGAAPIQGTGVAGTQWNGGAIDTANDELWSIAGYKPVSDETRAEFRDIAGNVGSGWRQQDEALFSAIQLLYLTEYADFYSQSMIGTGNTSYSGFLFSECIAKTGISLGDGNATNASNTAEDAVDTGGSFTNGIDVFEYMTYRGIENLYGGLWQFNDGLNILDRVPYVSNDDTNFADDTSVDYVRVEDTGGDGITMPSSNGYQLSLFQTQHGFYPASIGGASNTHITDHYFQSTGWRVAIRGGGANDGSLAGAFTLFATFASLFDGGNFGGRLCF